MRMNTTSFSIQKTFLIVDVISMIQICYWWLWLLIFFEVKLEIKKKLCVAKWETKIDINHKKKKDYSIETTTSPVRCHTQPAVTTLNIIIVVCTYIH